MKNIRREDWESLEPTVHGWGINDVNYNIGLSVNTAKNKRTVIWTCPYYIKWYNMIGRCFNEAIQDKQPTYRGCIVCEEWKYLSNFIKWVKSQPNRDWENCDLDKDLLVTGNKVYSPETCVFISESLNSFLRDMPNNRGCHLIGVFKIKSTRNPYVARCRNPFDYSSNHVGVFSTELEAHKAWQAKKHQYSCVLSYLEKDIRVIKALQERYAPDKDWTNV